MQLSTVKEVTSQTTYGKKLKEHQSIMAYSRLLNMQIGLHEALALSSKNKLLHGMDEIKIYWTSTFASI